MNSAFWSKLLGPSLLDCDHCGNNIAASAEKVTACGSCASVFYCSPMCEAIHFPTHICGKRGRNGEEEEEEDDRVQQRQRGEEEVLFADRLPKDIFRMLVDAVGDHRDNVHLTNRAAANAYRRHVLSTRMWDFGKNTVLTEEQLTLYGQIVKRLTFHSAALLTQWKNKQALTDIRVHLFSSIFAQSDVKQLTNVTTLRVTDARMLTAMRILAPRILTLHIETQSDRIHSIDLTAFKKLRILHCEQYKWADDDEEDKEEGFIGLSDTIWELHFGKYPEFKIDLPGALKVLTVRESLDLFREDEYYNVVDVDDIPDWVFWNFLPSSLRVIKGVPYAPDVTPKLEELQIILPQVSYFDSAPIKEQNVETHRCRKLKSLSVNANEFYDSNEEEENTWNGAETCVPLNITGLPNTLESLSIVCNESHALSEDIVIPSGLKYLHYESGNEQPGKRFDFLAPGTFPTLKQLHLNGEYSVTNEFRFSNLPRTLTVLDMSYIQHVFEYDLHLSYLPQLKSIVLYEVGDMTVHFDAMPPDLEHLHINVTRVTGQLRYRTRAKYFEVQASDTDDLEVDQERYNVTKQGSDTVFTLKIRREPQGELQ